MLKKPAGFVLASLKASTYHRARAAKSSSGWVGEKDYASPKTLGAHRLAPVRKRDAHILRVADLAAVALGGLFDHPAGFSRVTRYE